MHPLRQVKDIVPYVVALAAAAYLYTVADRFEFPAMPGRMGPDGWPKLILVCLAAVCLFEIGRRLVVGDGGTQHAEASLLAPADAASEPAESEEDHPLNVAAAIAATLAYLVLFEIVGFFLDTVLYIAVLMWAGRFRRPLPVALVSVIGTLLFMTVFMRVIFVSLPIGAKPFSEVSLAVMAMLGVH
jgi:putative tricarboxylic transport membrane protein